MTDMKRQAGWAVKCYALSAEPIDREDLVFKIELPISANFDLELFDSEEQAWAVARKVIERHREIAEKDVALFSQPYTSPNGITYYLPEAKLNEFRAEAEERLRVAEAALKLCP